MGKPPGVRSHAIQARTIQPFAILALKSRNLLTLAHLIQVHESGAHTIMIQEIPAPVI